MAGRRFAALALLLATALTASAAERAGARRDLVVFALGAADPAVPPEALASADAAIMQAFVNLGRYRVIGRPERFSAAAARDFARALERAGGGGAPLAAGERFGDVRLTEDLIDKLRGVLVVPTITGFRSGYNEARNRYETAARTSVAILDAAEGSADFLDLATEGSSEESEEKAIRSALADLADRLDVELGSLSAFVVNAQVLRVGGGRVKLRLGADGGVKRGDEYALVDDAGTGEAAEEAEIALILIDRVGPEDSSGRILYGESAVTAGARLKELPRLGLDIAPYGRYLRYFSATSGGEGAFVGGVRCVPTRGFYALKPLFGLQVTADRRLWFPVAGFLGVQCDRYRRRFTLSANAAVGGATNLVYAALENEVEGATETGGDAPFLSHCGFIANVGAGFLALRDLRLFAEAGLEYWFSLVGDDAGLFAGYGGVGATVGAAIKL